MALIDQQDALDILNEQIEQCNKALGSFDISAKDEYAIKVERASLKAYKEQLENLPIVQPKRGKWILEYNTTKNGYYRTAHYCSCCKFYYTTSPEEMNFCPHCGADMRGNTNV